MADTRGFKRALVGIADPGLRLDWLRDKLACWPPEQAALLLDAVLGEAETGDEAAREVLLTVVMVAVTDAPAPLLTALRETAIAHTLLSLERLLRVPPPGEGPQRAPLEPPVPDYGAGRELTLGERRALARKPNRAHFDKLLADPHPMVVRLLLDNPRLTEDDVLHLVAMRPARMSTLREVVRVHRWLCRPRVRMAILLNPGSPPELATPLLGLCTRGELVEIGSTASAATTLRATALELLQLRLPQTRPAAEPLTALERTLH